MTAAESWVEVEALRDEGWSDDEIETELGVTIARLKRDLARERNGSFIPAENEGKDEPEPEPKPKPKPRRVPRENASALVGEAPSGDVERTIRMRTGERVPTLFEGFADDERHRMIRLLSQFEREDEALDVEISSTGKNARPAPTLRNLTISRGAKVKRVAEAIARIQGKLWWDLDPRQRISYVKLADLTLSAVELVEHEHTMLENNEFVKLAEL